MAQVTNLEEVKRSTLIDANREHQSSFFEYRADSSLYELGMDIALWRICDEFASNYQSASQEVPVRGTELGAWSPDVKTLRAIMSSISFCLHSSLQKLSVDIRFLKLGMKEKNARGPHPMWHAHSPTLSYPLHCLVHQEIVPQSCIDQSHA